MKKELNFDCDGTWIDLYGVDGWLDDLTHRNARPYKEAKPLVNLSVFAKLVNKLQRKGYTINIISWLAKDSTKEFDREVTITKINWFKKHVPSIKWDNIYIVPYGTPKSHFGSGILFDDEEKNRKEWKGVAYSEKEMMAVLRTL